MKKTVTAFLITILLFSSPALAANSDYSAASDDYAAPSAEAIIVDFVVVRPLSIIGTAIGCGAFVATLPFTVWSKERMAKAGNALVVEPGRFAFVRPLGEGL
jgi:hypothetical protein